MTTRPSFPLPRVDDSAGKESRGRVLVVGGSAEIPGAVLLASTAALRVGAGKLQLATAASVARLMAIAMPEARVMPLQETEAGAVACASPALLEAAQRADAIILGPGCDPTPQWLDLVEAVLTGSQGVVVLDAGALPADVVDKAAGRCIVTPHAGEMAAITGLSIEDVQADAAAVAQRYSDQNQCVVVLKGMTTTVTAPSQPVWVHEGGSIALGTSGSGDVLAGVIGGLAARGAHPLAAAQWGVYLHGMAGLQFEQRVSEVGLLARDLPDLIPPLLREFARQ